MTRFIDAAGKWEVVFTDNQGNVRTADSGDIRMFLVARRSALSIRPCGDGQQRLPVEYDPIDVLYATTDISAETIALAYAVASALNNRYGIDEAISVIADVEQDRLGALLRNVPDGTVFVTEKKSGSETICQTMITGSLTPETICEILDLIPAPASQDPV